MRGVDTNVLVRFLTQDDPEQARRVDSLFSRLKRTGESAYVSVVVLCELAWVLRSLYGLRRQEIHDALETLLEADRLEIEGRGIVHRAVTLYGHGSGDFADYVIGLRNRQAGCQDTLTLDRRLGQSDLFTML
jgi:predicted nucleic-acid-binding protein